ncbi:MAG: hypothetical protein HUJ29_11885 [Gammaproteobacteria bacterium]|nr:hypothetical protein [Gammaproteobacteria bacterium]
MKEQHMGKREQHRIAIFPLLTLMGVILLGGCDSDTSEDMATSDIRATLDVETYGDGSATVHADLARASSGFFDSTYIELICPDMLTTSSSTQPGSKVMRQSQSAVGKIYYYAYLDGVAGDTFTVSLLRDESHVSADSSSVIMPDDFTITAPAAGSSFARNTQDLIINWDVTGDNVAISASGPCIDSYSLSGLTDNGSHTIEAGTLVYVEYPEPGDPNYQGGAPFIDQSTCGIEITVSKYQTGTLDSAFNSGSFTAYNRREISLNTSY